MTIFATFNNYVYMYIFMWWFLSSEEYGSVCMWQYTVDNKVKQIGTLNGHTAAVTAISSHPTKPWVSLVSLSILCCLFFIACYVMPRHLNFMYCVMCEWYDVWCGVTWCGDAMWYLPCVVLLYNNSPPFVDMYFFEGWYMSCMEHFFERNTIPSMHVVCV